MNLIERNICILTNKDDLEQLYTFKDFPIFMGCTEDNISTDLNADMTWCISKNTGIIQLKNLIPLNVLYNKSHGSGVVGKLWNEHHLNFSNFVSKFEIKNVLEIGGGHGKLAFNLIKIKENLNWTIIEPNIGSIKKSNNINVIEGFFDNKFSSNQDFDTIIFSHLFEHIYDPNVFINDILRIVKNGDKLLFSVPNMKEMLKRKYTNCLNFEHTLFLTEPYIEYIFDNYNFKLIKKEKFLSDHSIFYAYEFDKNHIKTIELKNYYIENKNIFFEYIYHYTKSVESVNKFLSKTTDEVYLFGAHIFSQYLISFGLNLENILAILDNDIEKQEKRLYGTNLYVKSPKILQNKNNITIILSASFYNNEIKNDFLNINPNINFLELI